MAQKRRLENRNKGKVSERQTDRKRKGMQTANKERNKQTGANNKELPILRLRQRERNNVFKEH